MNYCIYGAGNNLDIVIEQVAPFLNITGIIDNSTKKIGKIVKGIVIQSSDEFFKNEFSSGNIRIIVSVTKIEARNAIEKDLMSKGLKKGEHFFVAEDICVFLWEQLPGIVSGVVELPKGFIAKKTSDPNSYLIQNTEKKIFRVIKKNYKTQTKAIFDKCKKNAIFGNYIVDSWIINNIDFYNKKDEMVIEHKFISPITYCYEWPPEMYEEYVEFMLDFIISLTKADLRLSDPHGLNATINDGKFVFLDFGAISEGIALPREIMEIINTLILPLLLIKKNQKRRAYLYLEEHEITMSMRDVIGYLSEEEKYELKNIYENAIYICTKNDVYKCINQIKIYLNKFANLKKQLIWGDYQDFEWVVMDEYDKWSTKMKNVIKMIKKCNVRSIVDIAGNQGWYSAYFDNEMESIVVVDMDMEALDKLWKRIKKVSMKKVIPMKMSICAPSLGRHYDGLIDGKSIKPLRESGCNRIKSELALALAIVHHLAFREHLSFNEIIKLLLSYTDSYLIVEFIDKNDEYIQNFKKDEYGWYTKEAFENELKKQCSIVEILNSTPEETRTLYLCNKQAI